MAIVSVVIPTYNRAEFVVRAIDSVLEQTWRDYEVIVVDDGSTDNTKEVLGPYMDRISYIYQDNAGVSVARNTGIEAAKGQWVAFLDSDDEWLPEKLAVQMSCVSNNPEIVAHVTNATVVLGDDDTVDLFTIRGRPGYCLEGRIIERPFLDVLKFQFFTPTLMASRRKAMDIGGFDEKITIWEDGDFMRRLSLEGPWGVSNRSLVLVYRRPEAKEVNLSRQRKECPVQSYRCQVRMYDKLWASDKLQPRERRLLAGSRSGARFNLGLSQLRSGRRKEGLVTLKQSIADRPSVKSVVKYVLVKCFGQAGARLIEKKRSLNTNEFRRSDYYAD
ncbi:MAG: glycosyltransferase family 2 protein [Sedimentisphaerales bacterium]|nr:glycosyltransferase family 2 protein [Sedimentisphaerales bacterium]